MVVVYREQGFHEGDHEFVHEVIFELPLPSLRFKKSCVMRFVFFSGYWNSVKISHCSVESPASEVYCRGAICACGWFYNIDCSRDPEDPGDFHQRIALRATIASAIGPVDVVSTHMSLSETAQKRTLKELASWTSSVSPVFVSTS